MSVGTHTPASHNSNNLSRAKHKAFLNWCRVLSVVHLVRAFHSEVKIYGVKKHGRYTQRWCVHYYQQYIRATAAPSSKMQQKQAELKAESENQTKHHDGAESSTHQFRGGTP